MDDEHPVGEGGWLTEDGVWMTATLALIILLRTFLIQLRQVQGIIMAAFEYRE